MKHGGDYFSLEKKAKVIAFGTSKEIKVIKKIKCNGKNETSLKIGWHIVNDVITLALRR